MDNVVIVTGGTRGIGLETARKFLEKGDKVVVASVDSEEVIRQSMDSLSKLGEVHFVECNLTSQADCEKAVQTAVDQYGRIDLLVNVAGVVGKREPLVAGYLDDIYNTININLMGTINIGHFVSKVMVEQKSGVIINVGSICGSMANTESIGYHASKGGVKMVTQAMARELSPFGVRVLSVAPGWVNTAMIDAPIAEIGGKLHMKGRIIEPREIADAIYLLSLPEASAINGSTVMVDDGYASFKGVEGYQA
ncbi:SDR family NAD(P)-dependent oxidoreductase [Marinobacterium lutimaris]|uniref:NAD(P)-dependent dehydrogenase, short-chain alcohol dehydrogenase family n=1 Tax=Marinobacterium lutimaris TaxID=568106 RepID=A0A1H5X9J6_9GAMM|nr:SDR family oxidoreductase [Marinobacterium lutimaris]SEG08444.1 NAD(P)-dependent dehydrogenase, short-chain alcohol dehydrogenase family [Marinobacterium lutimaris]